MRAEVVAVTEKQYFVGIVFSIMFFVSESLQAESHYVPAKEYHGELSADTILKHNTRLLIGSSIGLSLKDSTHWEVKVLYQKARNLFNQAKQAHSDGQIEQAKSLSYQSIGL
ncbi:hypothetical protein, partial [Kaarinaea lacus]